MCTKTLPLGSLCVFVCAEEAEEVGPRGVKGYEARNHASTQSSGQILLCTGTRRLLSNQLFIIVSLIIMFPEDFILVFSLERIIMIKLFNNVALSFIWPLTQEFPGALQRLIMIHKAQKMDLILKHFGSREASINERNRSRNLKLGFICLIVEERDFLLDNPVIFFFL